MLGYIAIQGRPANIAGSVEVELFIAEIQRVPFDAHGSLPTYATPLSSEIGHEQEVTHSWILHCTGRGWACVWPGEPLSHKFLLGTCTWTASQAVSTLHSTAVSST